MNFEYKCMWKQDREALASKWATVTAIDDGTQQPDKLAWIYAYAESVMFMNYDAQAKGKLHNIDTFTIGVRALAKLGDHDCTLVLVDSYADEDGVQIQDILAGAVVVDIELAATSPDYYHAAAADIVHAKLEEMCALHERVHVYDLAHVVTEGNEVKIYCRVIGI